MVFPSAKGPGYRPRSQARSWKGNPGIFEYLQNIVNAVASGGIPGGPLMDKMEPPTTLVGKQRVAPKVTLDPVAPKDRRKGNAFPDSAVDDLYEYIAGMNTTFDYESALQDALEGIKGSYGAQIGSIRSGIGAARKSTKRDRREVEAMYSKLARSFAKDAGRATKQGERNAGGMVKITNQGNNIMRKSAEASEGMEADLLKGLGIEEVGPDVISMNKLDQAINRNTNRGTAAARDEQKYGNIQNRYMTRSAVGAEFEGQDRSADMLASLQDFIRGQRSQIAGLKGQRASEVANTTSSLAQTAAEFEAQQEQEMWERLMAVRNLEQDLDQQNIDNQFRAKQFRWDKRQDILGNQFKKAQMQSSMQQDQPDLLGMLPGSEGKILQFLQAAGSPDLNKAYAQLMALPMFQQGFIQQDKGQTTDLTRSAAYTRALQFARKRGLPEPLAQILASLAMSSV